MLRKAFTYAQPVWISDVTLDSTFGREQLARRAGLRAAFAFPLVRGEDVLGVLEFFHGDVREPDPLLIEIAAALGSEIGQYIVRMQAEQAVKYMAMHDALTRLPNRGMFNERLASAIAVAQRHERTLAVLFVDLDRFKVINDTLGHEAGDEVLREVASRLVRNLRRGDTVARLGGDEFIVLLEDVPDPLYMGSVSHKLIGALAAPFSIREREYRVTASIGVSAFPADGNDPETLLKHADLAMYRAKERGRNAFEFYSERLGAGSLERLRLESGLRRALERDELTLHFQPQIEACTGRIVGMEALVRWQHPEMGLLAPSRFIRLAEETGLIVAVGDWVLNTACRAHREWQRMRIPPARLAVNPLAPPVSPCGAGEGHAEYARGYRLQRQMSRNGDHRKDGDARSRECRRHDGGVEAKRDTHRDGRFRDRLLLAGPSETLSHRQSEGGPLVHRGCAGRRGQRGDHTSHHGRWRARCN